MQRIDLSQTGKYGGYFVALGIVRIHLCPHESSIPPGKLSPGRHDYEQRARIARTTLLFHVQMPWSASRIGNVVSEILMTEYATSFKA